MKNICCIFNSAPHYRFPIYKLMSDYFKCNFIFSQNPFKVEDIVQINSNELAGTKKVKCKSFLFGQLYYQKNVVTTIWKYDVIILGGMINCLSDWLILFLSKFTGTKVFLWTHAWYGRETIIKSIVKKIFYNLATANFVYGNYAKSLMNRKGFNPQKIFVIYNSLNYDIQVNLRTKLKKSNIYFNHFNNHFPTIIFIGRLTISKNLEMILKSIFLLQKKGVNCNVTFIGDGPAKKKLISLVEAMRLKKYTWFYGETYNEIEIANLIYNADVCVSPGNVGLTAIHSLAYGTPVITHNNFYLQMPEFEAIIPSILEIFLSIMMMNHWHILSQNGFIEEIEKKVRRDCYDIIDKNWNPKFQLDILKIALNLT